MKRLPTTAFLILAATCAAAETLTSPGIKASSPSACASSNWQTRTTIAADGTLTLTCAQPAFSDVSGTIAFGQQPAGGSSSLFWRGDGSWAAPASGAAWSAITNPSGNLSLTMGANTSTFTFNATTSTANLWTLTDTTNNTGTGIMFNLLTASGSTLKPLQVTAKGSSNGFNIDASGNLNILGAATVTLPANGSACTICASDGSGTGLGIDTVGAATDFYEMTTKYADIGASEGLLFDQFRRVCWSTSSIGSGTNVCIEKDAAGRIYFEDRANGRPASINAYHIGSSSTAPTITAGGCTGSAVQSHSTDMGGGILVGTSACTGIKTITMTFNAARTVAPFCLVHDVITPTTVTVAPTTTTGTLVLTNSVDFTANDVFWYHCDGY